MKLNYKVLGEGSPLLILHGVFGSLDNWLTLGKQFALTHKVFLIDQRNHGHSPHSDEFNYQAMSGDLLELINSDIHNQPVSILGHSMGGKTAMNFACDHEDLVEKLIVVDIAPRSYPPHHKEIFEGFYHLNLSEITSRKEADQKLGEVIKNPGIRMFLLKNLSRNSNQEFYWKINLNAIEENAEAIGRSLSAKQIFNRDTLFIRGANSDYITSQDESSIKNHFPKSSISTIENSGHWVHAEQPANLFEQVDNFLKT